MTDIPKRVIIWAAVSSTKQGAPEKESIPDQLRRQRERAARNGWLVIDEIIVEHSREYLTYYEFSRDAADEGWPDPLRMWDHWQQKDFDILSCRELDRVGREQSILSEFVSRCIRAGAQIVQLESSDVDIQNYRWASAVGGLGAAEHIDKMRRGRNLGMIARAGRGEKIGRKIPRFYVADENGKLQPDREHYQRFFDDVSDLFLAGTSYEQFPEALAQRGHINETTDKPYDKTVVKRLFLSARTWGHAEFNRTGRKRGSFTQLAELWITGRYDPPPNIYFKPDVIEPIWTGQQREDMIDELERRFNGIRGASKPNDTYALTRICVCEECNRYMVVQVKNNPNVTHYYLVCHHGRLQQYTDCNNNKMVRYEYVQQYLDSYIQSLQSDNVTPFEVIQTTSRIPSIDGDIAKLKERIDNLVDAVSKASLSSRADYQQKIDKLSAQRETLQAERARVVSSEREATYTERQRKAALATLAGCSVWDYTPTQTNQLLRKILGNRRVKCNHGDVTGLRVIG